MCVLFSSAAVQLDCRFVFPVPSSVVLCIVCLNANKVSGPRELSPDELLCHKWFAWFRESHSHTSVATYFGQNLTPLVHDNSRSVIALKNKGMLISHLCELTRAGTAKWKEWSGARPSNCRRGGKNGKADQSSCQYAKSIISNNLSLNTCIKKLAVLLLWQQQRRQRSRGCVCHVSTPFKSSWL